jgi:hypothetical protein
MFHVILEINLFKGPKADDVPLVKKHSLGLLFDWESTVLVASWIEERFDKDWQWWSSIARLQCCLTKQTIFQEKAMADGGDNIVFGFGLAGGWLVCSGMWTEGKVV